MLASLATAWVVIDEPLAGSRSRKAAGLVFCIFIGVLWVFGGQELCHFPQNFTQLEAEAHIRAMAEFWAQVQTRNFNPQTMADVIGDVYKIDDGETIVANAALELACQQLAQVKQKLSDYKEAENGLKEMIQKSMGTKATLKTFSGDILATWKTAKGSEKFDEETFKKLMPDTYSKFIKQVPGSRRFLIK